MEPKSRTCAGAAASGAAIPNTRAKKTTKANAAAAEAAEAAVEAAEAAEEAATWIARVAADPAINRPKEGSVANAETTVSAETAGTTVPDASKAIGSVMSTGLLVTRTDPGTTTKKVTAEDPVNTRAKNADLALTAEEDTVVKNIVANAENVKNHAIGTTIVTTSVAENAVANAAVSAVETATETVKTVGSAVANAEAAVESAEANAANVMAAVANGESANRVKSAEKESAATTTKNAAAAEAAVERAEAPS